MKPYSKSINNNSFCSDSTSILLKQSPHYPHNKSEFLDYTNYSDKPKENKCATHILIQNKESKPPAPKNNHQCYSLIQNLNSINDKNSSYHNNNNQNYSKSSNTTQEQKSEPKNITTQRLLSNINKKLSQSVRFDIRPEIRESYILSNLTQVSPTSKIVSLNVQQQSKYNQKFR